MGFPEKCDECDLCRDGIFVVPAEGSVDADVMFVGRDPGYNENKERRPFIGEGGQFLRSLINQYFGGYDDIYITNLVKCNTPNNVGPTEQQVKTCFDTFLYEEILELQPRVILTLGLDATRKMFDCFAPSGCKESYMKMRMGELSGKKFYVEVNRYHKGRRYVFQVTIIPCYHPSPRNNSFYGEIARVVELAWSLFKYYEQQS